MSSRSSQLLSAWRSRVRECCALIPHRWFWVWGVILWVLLAPRVEAQTEGLIQHFDFEEDWLITGSLIDKSTSGNHADCQKSLRPDNDSGKALLIEDQCPEMVSGPTGHGKAGSFSGSMCRLDSDYFALQNNPALQNLARGTVAVWINYQPPDDPNLQVPFSGYPTQFVLDARKIGVLHSWSMWKQYGVRTQVTLNAANDSPQVLLVFPDPEVHSSWNHYAFSWNESSAFAYYNGQLVQETNKSGIPYFALSNYITIGALKHNTERNASTRNCKNQYEAALQYYKEHEYPGYEDPLNREYVMPNGGFLNGKLDDLRIYNRSLTVAEIKALYDGTSELQRPAKPGNLRTLSAH